MRDPLAVAAAQPLCTPFDVAANSVEHASALREDRNRADGLETAGLAG